jgi:hypothetical protein
MTFASLLIHYPAPLESADMLDNAKYKDILFLARATWWQYSCKKQQSFKIESNNIIMCGA